MSMQQLAEAFPLTPFFDASSEKGQLLCRESPPWESHKYQLISLWMILKNYAYSFAEVDKLLTSDIVSLLQRMSEGGEWDLVPESDCHGILKVLEKTNVVCQDLGLRGTPAYIRKIENFRPWRVGSLCRDLMGVRDRMEEELSKTYFLHIPAGRVSYYDSAFFGEEIEEKFPSAHDDMREAGNCFVLCRWTAVVYHCMGIVQSGLVVVGQHLKMENAIDVHTDDWNGIITKIEGAVVQQGKAATTLTAQSEWKKIEPLYSEMISDVRAMKNAWRNPTAHFRRTYTEEQAEKVLERVKDFMRHLAIELQLRE